MEELHRGGIQKIGGEMEAASFSSLGIGSLWSRLGFDCGSGRRKL